LGITLFLAHLARETGEATYEKLSRASLAGALAMRNHETLGLSAFNGHAAVAYTLAHLGLLWDDAKLLQQAHACLDAMETGVAADRHLDVMGGAAGAALVCLRLYALNNDARALEVAEQCGEHLWRVMEWEKEGKPAHPLLTGLSHGAAGFAWAWAELASTTGNERFFRAFQKALAYERSHFLPEENNWADLRDSKSARETGAFWCHGAPGIGLSRLMIDPSLKDSTLRDEWTIAVNKTLESGFGWGHSLCHGDFGNLDFLLLSARRTGNRDLEQQCLEIGARSVRQGVANGWRFGLHEQAELIGLMLGLAGIGYGLLRLWNPMIPSVLALELPQIQQGG
jgi:type 2 lantibiotic biosynthesis protein LanM